MDMNKDKQSTQALPEGFDRHPENESVKYHTSAQNAENIRNIGKNIYKIRIVFFRNI